MLLSEAAVQLVGRISTWQRRFLADAHGACWVAWLTHPTCGTIGVYLPADQEPPDRGRQHRLVVGQARLCRVRAGESDPRVADDSSVAPVLICITHMAPYVRATAPHVGVATPTAPRVRVGHASVVRHGMLAPLLHAPDIACFVPHGCYVRPMMSWRRPFGVLTTVERTRYLRYLLLP